MGSVEHFTFFTLMEESIMFLPKNRKLMSFVAISSLVLCSSFYLLSLYPLHPVIKDMYTRITKFVTPDLIPSTPAVFGNFMEYMAQVPMDEIMLFLGNSVLTFFLGIATILIFATSYTREMLSLKGLLSLIGKTCRRTLVTVIYLSVLLIGYFFVVGVLASPLFIFPNSSVVGALASLIGFHGLFLSLYLFVSGIMAIVVSVVEENCYGRHALKRAAALLEDNRMEGLMLNLCYSILAFIVPPVLRTILDVQGLVTLMVCEVFLVNFSVFLKIWLLVAYTSFYFHCKMFQGEIPGLHVSVLLGTKANSMV